MLCVGEGSSSGFSEEIRLFLLSFGIEKNYKEGFKCPRFVIVCLSEVDLLVGNVDVVVVFHWVAPPL